MTGYVADLSWKSGARAIEKLDGLRSTMAVNVLRFIMTICYSHQFWNTVTDRMYSLKDPTGKTSNYIQTWRHIPGYFNLQHERC